MPRLIGGQDYDARAPGLPVADRVGIAGHRAAAPGQEEAPALCLVKRLLYMAEFIGSEFLGEKSDFGGRFGVVHFAVDYCLHGLPRVV